MAGSAVAALREGRWRQSTVTPLSVAALVAGVLDFLTTAHIVTDPAYYEGNEFYASLADIDPWLAVGVMAARVLLFLALAWLSFGWLTEVAGVSLVVLTGISGLNNVILFQTGTAPFVSAPLSISFITQVLLPVLGFGAGVGLARLKGPVPPVELVAVAAVTVATVGGSHLL